jgi:hypothetical protein
MMTDIGFATATAVERPILFSDPMVRALLAGTKTQTRRVVKPQPDEHGLTRNAHIWPDNWKWFDSSCLAHRCPYGRPGDRLWVREAFMHEPADYCWEASVSIPCRPAHTVYRADFPEADRPQRGVRWSPSIHMPRALSRITLEVVAVRVERLQDISEADAIAEGCLRRGGEKWWQGYTEGSGGFLIHTQHMGEAPPDWMIEPKPDRPSRIIPAKDAYRGLWDSINGRDSWDANPWVWVVEFRRI